MLLLLLLLLVGGWCLFVVCCLLLQKDLGKGLGGHVPANRKDNNNLLFGLWRLLFGLLFVNNKQHMT